MGQVEILNSSPRVPPKEDMTFEEFLEWVDEDTHAEWVGGKVIMTSPASDIHQDVKGFLYLILRGFIRARNLGWIRDNPFLMRLPNAPAGREPDILFLRREHLGRLHPTYLDGPADLVVEIISPESLARDRGEKFVEYETAGIPEYWLIDPIRRRAEFYSLNSAGQYRSVDPDAQGIFRSQVVDGFWLRVEWLWQDPLPLEEDALREIRG